MQKRKKLSARILSTVLTVAMVGTMLPTTVFATKGDVPTGSSSINTVGTIQSFDKLEDRFAKSTGTNAPDHVYSLSVALDTPFEDLQLPDELTAMVERTTTATKPAEDKPVNDSGTVDEVIPNEDETTDETVSGTVDEAIPNEDESTDETVSGNEAIATPSEPKKEVIEDEDVPLAPEPKPEQDEETVVTTVKSETVAVTWNSDKEYQFDENGEFIYTAELPEGYALADGVNLPQIYVFVGRQARTTAATRRSTTLNLHTISSSNAMGATSNNGVYTNVGEKWAFDSNTKTLTLSGVDFILSGNNNGINLPETAPVIIELIEGTANSITTASARGIYGKDNIEIKGGGSLTIVSTNGTALFSTKTITVSNGTLDCTTKSPNMNAITAFTELIINGGTVSGKVDNSNSNTPPISKEPTLSTSIIRTSTADWNNTNGGTVTITVTVNGTEYAGNTLQEAIGNLDGGADTVTSLNITAGTVTENDWHYLKNLTALQNFEIDSAVATVADIPDSSGLNRIFPGSIVTVTVPQAITIGACAFSGCRNLTTVSFLAATNIRTAAFDDCRALTSVSFPVLTNIADQAFIDCTSLATLKLGATPPTVSYMVFEGCPATRALGYVDADGTALKGTALTTAQNAYKAVAGEDRNTTDNLWYGWTIVSEQTDAITITVNGSTTAFDGASLQAAITASGVETTAVTSLKITAGEVTTDDWEYLWQLPALATFEIDSAVTAVANMPPGNVFPKSIVTATVPQAIPIFNNAFYECTLLTSVSFPAATSIDDGAFSHTSLTSVSFPAATSVGVNAFWGCTSLTSVSFPAATSIGYGAFWDCTSLTSVSFPVATSISNGAFEECTSLTSVNFPAATSIGSDAFADCTSLTSVSFPAATSIGEYAFWDCTSLATLNLPATPPTVDADAFTNCPDARALGYVDADGTPLTGTDLTAAQVAYKAFDDGSTTDNLWYGWTIAAASTHVPVTGITSVPTTATVGTDLSLTGTVAPTTATNKTIVWSLKTEGTTGAAISGSTLSTTAAGTVTVTATITNGLTANTNYTQDFDITVNVPKTPASITVTTPPTKTTYTAGEAFNKAGMVVTATYTNSTTAAVSGYTFSPTTALAKTDTAITISYTENATTVTTTQAVIVMDAPTIHTITAMSGTGGSISPSGTVTVNNGGNKTFTISANSSYSISSVTVDGVNQGAIDTYTFNNVTGNHTISATFSYNGSGSSGGGSSSGGSTTTPAKPTENVTGSSNTNATVDNKGNTTTTVTDKNISDAVKAAQDAAAKKGVNAGEVTAIINVTSPANSNPNTVFVNLPKNVQEQIISNKISNVAIVIDKPDISIGMTLATITEMNKQANADIQLSATRTDATKLSTEAKNAIGNRPAFDLKATYASGSKSVTNFGTGTVSVAIPYTLQDGEIASGLYAVYVDGNGKVSYITNSSYDTESKVLRFSTNHFSVYGISYKAPVGFTDIANHWAKTDIEFVANRGLMSGTSNTTFSPNGPMTRGMFVTALGRLASVDVNSYKTAKFTDVKADTYYAPYVNWAAEKGIVKGTTDTTFAPEQAITRQEMAVIMSNYAKALGYQVPETRTEVTFADNGSIGNWAAPAVKQMQIAGILSGKDGNKFDPTGTATRGEISAMLCRYVELVIDRTTTEG